MEIAHLKEFVYLAETLSFKDTAQRFFVSRSVISRHLSNLEDTIGCKLIERGGHTTKLTEAGKVFYRESQILIRDYENAVEHVRAVQEEKAKIVRIGYLRNAARPVIVQFTRYMKANHPNVKLALTCMEYGELRRAMVDGVVDIALAVNVQPEVSRNYRSTEIYTDRFFAVMGKDNTLAQKTEGVFLSEISEETLLLPDSFVYSGLSEVLDEIMESRNQLDARAFYSDIDMMYLKVQTEGYVALSSSMNSTLFGEQFAILPILDKDAEFTVSAFYSNGFQGTAFEQCKEGFEKSRESLVR